jgi:hypothetical protein
LKDDPGSSNVTAPLNEYYVEIEAGLVSVGFSKRGSPNTARMTARPRAAALDVEWVLPPTTQPWGNRSMIFRDPAGNLINVFSRDGGDR